jgi:hypothetical protein
MQDRMLSGNFPAMKRLFCSLAMVATVSGVYAQSIVTPVYTGIDSFRSHFSQPPDGARPGVYWYFMDGNRTKAAMTEDLESMKRVGIGNVVFLEVNVGVPRGPVDLLSDQWKDLFKHGVREAERLGIEITLGTGPGWAGSGGPWVKPAQSMQHLVSSMVQVSGDSARKKIVLPVPAPKKPFFGYGTLTPSLRKEWEEFYEDVAVLAFPTIDSSNKINDIDEKALYYRAPYTSQAGVRAYFPGIADYPEAAKGTVIPKEQVIDLTGKMAADGTLNWDPPAGNWTILRFGSRNNGAVTRPAPVPGLGFEVDKMDTTSLKAHLDKYVGELFQRTGEPDSHLSGGFKRLHIDSWEMGSQNWTQHFREEFTRRRGYDPLPFYPVYAGNIVGSPAISERFLWDLRQTCQEMVLAYHAGAVKEYSHRHGLSLSIEPYDMNPAADLELGAVADIPMCEFWSKGFGFNSSFSCIEATSIAHVNGVSLVPAEAFTAAEEGWRQYPGSMKNQGDWAFATGVNRLVYHTFQHQSLDDKYRPGVTMGPYGVSWNRAQSWWSMADGYHKYITRCQYILQQGRTVADILYLTPEGAPHVFRAPASAMGDDAVMPDRKGFNFDGCAPSQLYKAFVKDGNVVFPGGAVYKVLVLPLSPTMTPALLQKIVTLVKDGATVIGTPPLRSPGLSDYPRCDARVAALAADCWGGTKAPASRTVRTVGKGKIIWGGEGESLYPEYGVTEEILHSMGVVEDFSSAGALRYTHRTGQGWDIYFVANKTDSTVKTEASFRVSAGSPELWDPMTGTSRPLPAFSFRDGVITIPLAFQSYQSFFIVFRGIRKLGKPGENFPAMHNLMTLSGPWSVSFDTAWGGPAHVQFDSLYDWTSSRTDGIHYYSGEAHYKKTFNLAAKHGGHVYLDLGKVKDMARVRLNGKDLGVVWTAPCRVDITDAVQARGNQLDITIANRWPNRLIGDERLPDDGIRDGKWPEWLLKGEKRPSGRYTFTTYKHYSKDSPLLQSGLLGPVKIVEEGAK